MMVVEHLMMMMMTMKLTVCFVVVTQTLTVVCHHRLAASWIHLTTRLVVDRQWLPHSKMSDLPCPTVDQSATCRRAVPPAGVSGWRIQTSGWAIVDQVLLIRWTRGSARRAPVWLVMVIMQENHGTLAHPGDQQTVSDLSMNTVRLWVINILYHCLVSVICYLSPFVS